MDEPKPIKPINSADKDTLSVNMSVYLRIILGTLFPERCSIEEYLIFDDVKKKIVIDKKEGEEIELKILADGKTTTWNKSKAKMKEVNLTKKEVNALINVCELASRQKNFPNNPQFFGFYTQLKEFKDSNKDS